MKFVAAPSWLRVCAGPVVVLLSAVAMFVWSFGRWADPVVDFGRELYVPWQMIEGKRLYADLTYYYGPVSPYLNSLWFRLFGVSYLSLVAGNMIVFTAILAALHSLLKAISSPFATTIALLVMVFVFSFSQYVDIGNYNFMSPYSHEVTHGLCLALVAIATLHRFSETLRLRWLGCSGFLLGLTFLTKHEMFVAALGALVVGLVVLSRGDWLSGIGRARALAAFVVPALLPPLLAAAILSRQMEPAVAFRGVLGPYPFLMNAAVWANPFFAARSGMDHPMAGLAAVARWTLALGALLVFCLLLERVVVRHPGWRTGLLAGAYLLSFGAFGFLVKQEAWNHVLMPLPFLLIGAVVVLGRRGWNRARAQSGGSRLLLGLVLSVFALLLLLKMPLSTRLFHYGFAMALPGTLLAVVAGLHIIPTHWKRSSPDRGVFQTAGLGVLTMFVLVHLVWTFLRFETLRYPFGDGPDRMWANWRGAMVESAVRRVKEAIPPNQTLVVLPEGTMVNYLSRRASSSSHTTFVPTDFAQYGEGALVESLSANPPDYVLTLARPLRDLREYGCQNLGEDCGRDLMRWVDDHYRETFAAIENGISLYSLRVRREPAEIAPAREEPGRP